MRDEEWPWVVCVCVCVCECVCECVCACKKSMFVDGFTAVAYMALRESSDAKILQENEFVHERRESRKHDTRPTDQNSPTNPNKRKRHCLPQYTQR